MRVHLICAGLAILLTGCSYVKTLKERVLPSRSETTSTSAESTPVAATKSEEIRTVDETPPPREESSRTASRSDKKRTGKKVDPFAEEKRTIGQDPREDRKTSSSSRAKTPAAAPDNSVLLAPMLGRVGIMNLLGKELRHVHAGTTPWGDHEKSYTVQYDFAGYVVEELRKGLLARTPYQPVMVNATGALLKAANTWQTTWNGKNFAPTFQREFDGIIKQNRLAMLIVISYPTIDDGVIGTSQTLTGSGLYTRSLLGSTQAAVFSTVQFYRITGEPAKLVLPVASPGERSVGDLPNAKLPEDLEDLQPRYLGPVYEPMRSIVQNKIKGLVSLPRKLGY
ncbi:MAG: hypothetical protein ACT4PZ_02480 [Panacagrimonas sp.]